MVKLDQKQKQDDIDINEDEDKDAVGDGEVQSEIKDFYSKVGNNRIRTTRQAMIILSLRRLLKSCFSASR